MPGKPSAAILLLMLAACSGAPSATTTGAAPAKRDPVAILAAADATREQGGYAEALQIYQQLLTADPTLKAAEYGAAESLLAAGKPEAAKPLFEDLVQQPEYRGRGLQGKGLTLLALGQRAAASVTLREATEADPALWRCWNALGTIADLKRQPGEAQALYARALAIRPDSAAIINNIGYSELAGGDAAQAVVEFRRALALDPQSETIQNNLRLALAAKGSYAEALRSVSRERMPSVLNNVGYMAMQRGDYAAAEGYFARAMEDSTSYNAVAAKNLDQLKSRQDPGR